MIRGFPVRSPSEGSVLTCTDRYKKYPGKETRDLSNSDKSKKYLATKNVFSTVFTIPIILRRCMLYAHYIAVC